MFTFVSSDTMPISFIILLYSQSFSQILLSNSMWIQRSLEGLVKVISLNNVYSLMERCTIERQFLFIMYDYRSFIAHLNINRRKYMCIRNDQWPEWVYLWAYQANNRTVDSNSCSLPSLAIRSLSFILKNLQEILKILFLLFFISVAVKWNVLHDLHVLSVRLLGIFEISSWLNRGLLQNIFIVVNEEISAYRDPFYSRWTRNVLYILYIFIHFINSREFFSS